MQVSLTRAKASKNARQSANEPACMCVCQQACICNKVGKLFGLRLFGCLFACMFMYVNAKVRVTRTVCVCVCVNGCKHVAVYVRMLMHVCICFCISLSMGAYLHAGTCGSMYVLCAHVMHDCARMYKYMYVCTSMYIHMNTHMQMDMHMYIQTGIHI